MSLDFTATTEIEKRNVVVQLQREDRQTELEKIVRYLKEEKGINIDPEQAYKQGSDIVAAFPGNRVIRRSNVIAEMKGHKLGRCKYGSRCESFRDDLVVCCCNNYHMIPEGSEIPTCYLEKVYDKKLKGRF